MEKLEELLFIILVVGAAGPVFVICFLVAVVGMGLYALPSFFDPEFYTEMFDYISSLDLGEMLELLKEYIYAHMEMY